jgi:2'-5' RNA ligase
MRLFVAIELPEEIKTALTALQQSLRPARADVAWAKPDNLHLTLKFLGETPADRIAAIGLACAEAAKANEPFTLTTNGTGFFPDERRPRIVWAGLSGAVSELQALQQQVEACLAVQGCPPEIKPFRPHLTLGRCKSPNNLSELAKHLQKNQLPALSFTVSELVLMQSQLHPTGSLYTPLQRARLGQ